MSEHLLTTAVDLLRINNWMQTEDGAKGRNRPEPIPRPGQTAEKKTKSERIQTSAKLWKQRQEQRRRRWVEAEQQRPAVA
ncbi:DUF5361 domain-containing protein [Polymorphospora rubra]|uniref:DUF5361 domain-containing protein n=1 Tax=Polymorphospora rubra TaxID=338584 RepID=UPI0033CEBD83